MPDISVFETIMFRMSIVSKYARSYCFGGKETKHISGLVDEDKGICWNDIHIFDQQLPLRQVFYILSF
ncbi:2789_t:CDS:1, partial [Funneliformis mosseae]